MRPLFQVSLVLIKHIRVDPLIVKEGFLGKDVQRPSLQRSSSAGAGKQREQAGGYQQEQAEAFRLRLKNKCPSWDNAAVDRATAPFTTKLRMACYVPSDCLLLLP